MGNSVDVAEGSLDIFVGSTMVVRVSVVTLAGGYVQLSTKLGGMSTRRQPVLVVVAGVSPWVMASVGDIRVPLCGRALLDVQELLRVKCW